MRYNDKKIGFSYFANTRLKKLDSRVLDAVRSDLPFHEKMGKFHDVFDVENSTDDESSMAVNFFILHRIEQKPIDEDYYQLYATITYAGKGTKIKVKFLKSPTPYVPKSLQVLDDPLFAQSAQHYKEFVLKVIFIELSSNPDNFSFVGINDKIKYYSKKIYYDILSKFSIEEIKRFFPTDDEETSRLIAPFLSFLGEEMAENSLFFESHMFDVIHGTYRDHFNDQMKKKGIIESDIKILYDKFIDILEYERYDVLDNRKLY